MALIMDAATTFHAMSWVYLKRKTSRGLFEPLITLLITNQAVGNGPEETDCNVLKEKYINMFL